MTWGPFEHHGYTTFRGNMRGWYFQRNNYGRGRSYIIDDQDHVIVQESSSCWWISTTVVDLNIEPIGPFPSLRVASLALMLLADVES